MKIFYMNIKYIPLILRVKAKCVVNCMLLYKISTSSPILESRKFDTLKVDRLYSTRERPFTVSLCAAICGFVLLCVETWDKIALGGII